MRAPTITSFERTALWFLVRIYRAVTQARPLPPETGADDKLTEAWAKDDRDYFWSNYPIRGEKQS